MHKIRLKKTLNLFGYNNIDHLSKKELYNLLHEHIKGGSVLGFTKNIINRVKGFLTGARKEASPDVRKFITLHRNDKVVSIHICRVPVLSSIQKILNAISLGDFYRKIKKYNYDSLFHLYCIITVSSSHDSVLETIVMEKNHVVEIKVYDRNISEGQCMNVPLNGLNVDFSTLITKAEQFQGDDFWIWTYSNNCQVFVQSILKANNLLNPQLEKFVVQCAKCVINENLGSFTNKVVNLAQRGDILLHGKGIAM